MHPSNALSTFQLHSDMGSRVVATTRIKKAVLLTNIVKLVGVTTIVHVQGGYVSITV